MKKKGHILMMNFVDESNSWLHFWMKVGCILPDFMLGSIIKGHKLEITKDKIFRKMQCLQKDGAWNISDCVKLGYILHYVEDYFTYVHNQNYDGNVKEHLAYEKLQYEIFCKNMVTNSVKVTYEDLPICTKWGTMENLTEWLLFTHREYCKMTPDINNDFKYMVQAVQAVYAHFVIVFNNNRPIRAPKYNINYYISGISLNNTHIKNNF